MRDPRQINFYAIDYNIALPIVPGNIQREWIENIPGTPYYYDLVMTMACQSGWEFRSPCDFTMEWNGGEKSTDTCVHSLRDYAHLFHTGLGNGICSIKTGYVIETPPDYAMMVMGAPSFFKDGATQLPLLMETNWAHMPFMLNWKMTRPGKVEIKKDEPIGFMTMIPHKQLDEFHIHIDSIFSNNDLYERYTSWETSKNCEDPYLDGITNSNTGIKTEEFHKKYRKLKKPTKKFTKLKKDDKLSKEENKDAQ